MRTLKSFTAAELETLASTDTSALTDGQIGLLERRAQLTIDRCQIVIDIASGIRARNAVRPESGAWATLGRHLAEGAPVIMHRGASAHFALQGAELQAESQRPGFEDQAADCLRLACESFRSARARAGE